MIPLLLTVVLTLLGVGVLLWALDALPWISADIKQVIRIVVIVIVAFWLIGLLAGMVPVPHFNYWK